MSKSNQFIDAVKTATAIHNGDYSSLRGKYFVIRDKMKRSKGRGKHVRKSKEEKMTLAKLAMEMRDGFKQVNNRIDNLEKDVNARIDRVESRINQIDARLDYCGLQIEQINKRLDYNGLKKLPESR